MLIRCPECLFERRVDLAKIPPTAQLATCPKCRSKFRFREYLFDEDGTPVAAEPGITPDAAMPPESHKEGAAHEDTGTPVANSLADGQRPEPVEENRDEYPDTAAYTADAVVPEAEEADAADEADMTVSAAPDVADMSQDTVSLPDGDSDQNGADDSGYAATQTDDDVPLAPVQEEAVVADDTPHAKPHRHLGAVSDAGEGIGDHKDIWDAIAAMGDGDCAGVSPIARHSLVEMGVPWENRGKMSLFAAWRHTVGHVLFSPAQFFSVFEGAGGYAGALLFFILTSLLGTALSVGGLVLFLSLWGDALPGAAAGIPAQALAALASAPLMAGALMAEALGRLLLLSWVLHLFVRLVASRCRPYATTFRIVAYSGAASLAGAVPGVGIIGGWLWFMALCLVGMRHGHSLGWGKTILAVLPVGMLILVAALLLSGAGG